jgi:hypothetical protein
MALHWRKRLFIEEYVAHPELNAAEVAARCGYERKYAKNRAWELLHDPQVKAAIEQKQQQLLAKVNLTAEAVIKDILAARQRCVEAGDGAWQTQGRLKCDELLGKYLGMWQEKLEVTAIDEIAERLRKARANAGIVIEAEEPKMEGVPQLEESSQPTEKDTPGDPPPLNPVRADQRTEPEDWVERLL